MIFKSTLGDMRTPPARGARTQGVPGRNLGDWIIFRVHLRVSSGIRTYNLKYVGGTETERQRRTSAGERRRGCRADAAGCNVTESGAVFVFRCSYFPRVSLCSHPLYIFRLSRSFLSSGIAAVTAGTVGRRAFLFLHADTASNSPDVIAITVNRRWKSSDAAR